MKMDKKHNFNRKIVISLSLVLVFIFIVTFSSSYAFFTTSIKGKEFVIYTGNLAVNYEKKTNAINVDNAYPMTDTEGLTTISHEFMVTNNGSVDARYQIRLELDESLKDMIDIRYIKMSYQVNGGDYSTPVLLSDLNSSLVFIKDVILNPTESNTYGIKLWIDLSAPNDIQGKTFKARIVVDSIQNVDDGYVVDTTPIIYLNKDSNGNQDIHLKTNDTYTELGVEKVEDDQEIFTPSQVSLSYEYYDGTNLSTVQSIDTSKNGIYYITYSITDKSGNTGKRVRIVTINPTDTIPTITLNGDVTITQEETEVYNELGVTVASDNQVVTIGEVKTSTVGAYIIRYIVVDSNGNLNSIIRIVNIKRKKINITFDYNYNDNLLETSYNTSSIFRNVISNLTYNKKEDDYGITHIATISVGELNYHSSAGYYFSGIGTPLKPGETYSFTFEARGSDDFVATIGSEQGGTNYFNISTDWKRYKHTFTAQTSDYVAFVFYGWGSMVNERTLEVRNIYISDIKDNLLKSFTILRGDTLHDIYSIPTRDGYSFIGWFTDPVYGNQIFDSSLVPDYDVTYYAHWKINQQ